MEVNVAEYEELEKDDLGLVNMVRCELRGTEGKAGRLQTVPDSICRPRKKRCTLLR
jgi:hypothetical protein